MCTQTSPPPYIDNGQNSRSSHLARPVHYSSREYEGEYEKPKGRTGQQYGEDHCVERLLVTQQRWSHCGKRSVQSRIKSPTQRLTELSFQWTLQLSTFPVEKSQLSNRRIQYRAVDVPFTKLAFKTLYLLG
ncbi:hypothetical protein TGMAS_360670 [Toxoplasma gondii MAS]|uniref:Uncharacterized protein n=2 Tax=Toxoplasma gondii TaxID=5811 RepID=A0A086QPX0_TOXGO|nr:hypothetical protein TGMAS_360670 [Toxoplasma gondii MAS]PUA87454.1 hypothetical protein TGBR9_360670 [Toxoplasma gondii TgCATBr9]